MQLLSIQSLSPSQHAAEIDIESVLAPDIKRLVIQPIIANLAIDHSEVRILINPTGRFVTGGPMEMLVLLDGKSL